MNNFFVQIVGPYDVTTVGPFDTIEKAQAFSETVPERFDAWVMTEKQLDAQFVEHGLMPIESPSRYVDGDLDWLKEDGAR
jgi:hypothetical protein